MIPLLLVTLIGAVLVYIVWAAAVSMYGKKILPWSTEAKLLRKIKAEEELTDLIKQARQAEDTRKETLGNEWTRRFEGRD